jgi:hypothetical protein
MRVTRLKTVAFLNVETAISFPCNAPYKLTLEHQSDIAK